MSFRIVRSSKFRHVFGALLSRDFSYENIRSSHNSNFNYLAVNSKFLAVILESRNGSVFIVIPLEKVSS